MDPELNCIHAERGLCPDCRAEHEDDPAAWYEYGYHIQGEANWQRLQAELAAEHLEAEGQRLEAPPASEDEIPF